VKLVPIDLARGVKLYLGKSKIKTGAHTMRDAYKDIVGAFVKTGKEVMLEKLQKLALALTAEQSVKVTDNRLTKSEAGYGSVSSEDLGNCEVCKNRVTATGCRLVYGSVDRSKVCDLFETE
jgi:hypothetical protein